MIRIDTTERVECPLCGGRGTTKGRAFRRDGPVRYLCGLCAGDGSIRRGRIQSLRLLREQMQRVADAMQGGDADRAAKETRVAMRVARRLLAS
jgi:DnaJ-class molecular chaperone